MHMEMDILDEPWVQAQVTEALADQGRAQPAQGGGSGEGCLGRCRAVSGGRTEGQLAVAAQRLPREPLEHSPATCWLTGLLVAGGPGTDEAVVGQAVQVESGVLLLQGHRGGRVEAV